MALSAAFSIIWLDAHIGLHDECKDLKTLFQTELAPVAAAFPFSRDSIDQMICCITELATPISFVSSVTDALQYIETDISNGKQVIFITSGTLGQVVIPEIQQNNFVVHSYYIFCGSITTHAEWVLEYLTDGLDIMMFDFETDLLLRLSRDLSKELIKQGEILLNNDPVSALKYFECARTLAENAVELDKPKDATDMHRPSTKHREVLDGENGLIAKAQRACNANKS